MIMRFNYPLRKLSLREMTKSPSSGGIPLRRDNPVTNRTNSFCFSANLSKPQLNSTTTIWQYNV